MDRIKQLRWRSAELTYFETKPPQLLVLWVSTLGILHQTPRKRMKKRAEVCDKAVTRL